MHAAFPSSAVSFARLVPYALVVGAHYAHVARIIQQEGVMAVRRVDLRLGHAALVVDQRLHDFLAARRRKAPIGRK